MENLLESARKLWQANNEKEAIRILSTITPINGPANTLIGNMHACAQRGLSNIKRDYKLARKYYQKAVELKDAEGALELGKLYFFGDGVKSNYDKAETFWDIAYNLGDEIGAFELANYYTDYKPEKIDKAIIIYNELIAKKKFIGSCEYKLSKIYRLGIGIEKNHKLELKFLNQGAKVLDFNCCSELARKYFKGDGVKQNLKKALAIIQKADTRGLFDSEKQEIIQLIKSKMKYL